jgi:hypothetical protein
VARKHQQNTYCAQTIENGKFIVRVLQHHLQNQFWAFAYSVSWRRTHVASVPHGMDKQQDVLIDIMLKLLLCELGILLNGGPKERYVCEFSV